MNVEIEGVFDQYLLRYFLFIFRNLQYEQGKHIILYMLGYASFLFLAVAVGSSTLYQLKRRNHLKTSCCRSTTSP